MPSSASWWKACWHVDKFVASISTTTSTIYTSPTGLTGSWTSRTLPASAPVKGLASNGSVVVATLTGTNVAYSYDAVTWYLGTMPNSGNWSCVCWAGGAINKFVAAASTNNRAAYSSDGVTWYACDPPNSYAWIDLAWNGTGVCLMSSANAINMWSTNGTSWTRRLTGGGITSLAANVVTGRMVGAIGNAAAPIYSDDNGATWANAAAGGYAGNARIIYDSASGLWVMSRNADQNRIEVSSDPTVSWTAQVMPASVTWRALAVDAVATTPAWLGAIGRSGDR